MLRTRASTSSDRTPPDAELAVHSHNSRVARPRIGLILGYSAADVKTLETAVQPARGKAVAHRPGVFATAWLAAVIALAPCASVAGDGVTLQPFSASYTLERSGFEAKRRIRLDRGDAPDSYLFTSKSEARGAAAAIKPEAVRELSRFVLKNGRVLPLEYRLEDGNDGGERNVSLKYHWQEGIIRVESRGESAELELHADLLTPLAIDAAFMHDLDAGGVELSYRVVEGTRVRQWTFQREGAETLRTHAGHFETYRYRLDRQSNREIRMWVAPALRFLPVRVEQSKGGELKMAIAIRKFAGFGPRERWQSPIDDNR